ncbi:MAG: inosine/xanthosine triphosphatase [Candidatus Micrarchaeota archaeon]|nr:inosine/xanthosine triphosphatase [Candidatus Micrarchaeota archaeon]
MKHCIIGGTFTYVHEGHLRLFKECKKFSKITVGITSDNYVKEHKLYPSFPLKKRVRNVKKALKILGILKKSAIKVIEDEYGGAERIKDADAIIVSPESAPNAVKINNERRKRGLRALKIIVVPIVFGEDLKKISCAKIFEGKTDKKGRIKKKLWVQIATNNPTKLAGAKNALRKIFGRKFQIKNHAEKSGVGAHPFDRQTFAGARNRALAAWKRSGGKCDYAIGIESGIFSNMKKGMHLDITVCCVYDGESETYGTGMGFAIPAWIIKKIKSTKKDLSYVMRQVAGIENIGYRQGALGWFSSNLMHRREQVEAAVGCAFVPRIAQAKRQMRY